MRAAPARGATRIPLAKVDKPMRGSSDAAGESMLLTQSVAASHGKRRIQRESRSRIVSIVSDANCRKRPLPASASNSFNRAPASS